MTVLLAILTWIFVIVLVVSLCLSAQRGDLMQTLSDTGDDPVGRANPLVLAGPDAAEHERAQPDDPQQAVA